MIRLLKNKLSLFSGSKSRASITSQFQFQRAAYSSHSDFILDLILTGAQKKHFNRELLKPEGQQSLAFQLMSTLTQERCPTHEKLERNSSIYIGLVGAQPVGFSWIIEQDLQKDKKCYEIYMFAVSSEYRRKKYGQLLLRNTISTVEADARVEARVYRNSEPMLLLLISEGFVRSSRKGKGVINLHMQK